MQVDSGSFHCRVVVIGEASVGKTSILNQLIDHCFYEHEQSTVGANYQLFVQEVDGVKIEIQIWDTAGQEKFRSLGPIYFRNSLGAVVVYDVTNRHSFDNLETWITSFQDVAGTNTVVTVVGNKCDMPESEIQIPESEAQKWAETKGYESFRTSAKTGVGVKETFYSLARQLLKNRMSRTRSKGSVSIHVTNTPRDEGCKC